MNTRGRSQLALGVILILLGAWFLMDKTLPAFHSFFNQYTEFPLNLLLIGAGILIVGLVLGQPSMAIPAAIVAGIGGIFYYQETTNNYDFVVLHVGAHSWLCWDRHRPRRSAW